jgi:pimeloyl-ACP methyl ester carboxylesterase
VAEHALTLKDDDPRVMAALKTEQQLFAFYGMQARTHFIPLKHLGIRMRVSEIGSGEPVLIVPGNSGDVFPLAALLAELPGRRIIAVNRPGGGASEGMDHRTVDFRKFAVETLTTVLDFFSLKSVPIVAHSIGGHWSLWMALDRPERVSALTLLGVPGNVISTQPPFALRLLSVPVLNQLLFDLISPDKPDPTFRQLAFIGHSPETCARLPAALADCYYYFQRLPHYRIASLSLMEQSNHLWRPRPEIRITKEQLEHVRQPTMFLWGTHDPFGSAETGCLISQNLPHPEFHAIQGAGHLPWLDNPAECGRLTRDFLAGQPKTSEIFQESL